MATIEEWKGLPDVKDLYDLELALSPPTRRVSLYSTAREGPLSRAGKMVGVLYDRVGRWCDDHNTGFPTIQTFGKHIKPKGPNLGQLLRGTPREKDQSDPAWRKLEQVFTVILLGTVVKEMHDFNSADPRHAIVKRMRHYFFERYDAKLPYSHYFSLEAHDLPSAQRPIEAKYANLDRGLAVLQGKTQVRLFIASGGISFGNTTTTGELTPVGFAVLASASVGLHTFYIFPDPVIAGNTEASADATRFRNAIERFVANPKWPDEIMCLISQLPTAERATCAQKIKDYLRLDAISPLFTLSPVVDQPLGNADHALIVGAQFFCPFLRFVYHETEPVTPKTRHCYVARSHGDVPFAIRASDEEALKFRRWVEAVLKC